MEMFPTTFWPLSITAMDERPSLDMVVKASARGESAL